MSTYVIDEGSRYLVKAENLEAAYKWLEGEGEFAHKVDICKDCIVLSADGYEDMFCGNVSYSFADSVADFMERFCEERSYACFYDEEQREFTLVWKDKDGTHIDGDGLANPFAWKMEELER